MLMQSVYMERIVCSIYMLIATVRPIAVLATLKLKLPGACKKLLCNLGVVCINPQTILAGADGLALLRVGA